MKLLKDNDFFAGLMNGPCKLEGYKDIDPAWIDDEMSEQITKIYNSLLPENMPFESLVRVIRHPEVRAFKATINSPEKHSRYLVVTLIPYLDSPYLANYPLFITGGIMSLYAWEMARAALAVSRMYAEVKFTEHPVPPIMNNASVEWVSLYLGEEPFTGSLSLKDMILDGEEINLSAHVIEVRKLDDPRAMKLVEAWDQTHKDTK